MDWKYAGRPPTAEERAQRAQEDSKFAAQERMKRRRMLEKSLRADLSPEDFDSAVARLKLEDKKMRETFVRRLHKGDFAVPPGRAADFVAALTPSWVGDPRGDTSWDDTPSP